MTPTTPTKRKKRKSTYQAASMVAVEVAEHFSRQLSAARMNGEINLAPEPTPEVIETIIDTAFWASLQREEGINPKISLAYLPPTPDGQSLIFEKRLPLSPIMLKKLSPGVERPGIHLGVWQEEGELFIWGTTRQILTFCFVLDVSEPGMLVIKQRGLNSYGKFTNIAVLKGDQIKIVDENSVSIPDCPELLTSLLGFAALSQQSNSVNVLVQMAVSIRAHGRGGILLVIPNKTENWRDSVVHPMQYPILPTFLALADLMRQEDGQSNQTVWQTALRRVVESVAGLTAVDGATIISNRGELLAFGAKISRSRQSEPVSQLAITEPVEGNRAEVIHPTQIGGTRHLAAAQFVYDQQDSIALVASQDGRFTVFTWSPCEGMVHAHRIDALLL